MVNPTYEKLGSAPSMIRELFAYGLRRSAEVGPENVFDYSLGNPSIPAPQPVQQALLDVLHDTDPIQVHGYSMAGGFDGMDIVRRIVGTAGERLTDDGFLIVEIGNEAENAIAAFPELELTWLSTSGGDDRVFLLTAEQLKGLKKA